MSHPTISEFAEFTKPITLGDCVRLGVIVPGRVLVIDGWDKGDLREELQEISENMIQSKRIIVGDANENDPPE